MFKRCKMVSAFVRLEPSGAFGALNHGSCSQRQSDTGEPRSLGMSVLLLPWRIFRVLVDATFMTELPVLICRMYALSNGFVTSPTCQKEGSPGARFACQLDRSLAVATVASAVLLSLRATLSLASGSWRQHRAALEVGSWRKLLALLMDALIWTALPVFVACVVHVDQGSSIRVCSGCHPHAAQLAATAAGVVMGLRLLSWLVMRAPMQCAALVLLAALGDEMLVRVQLRRAEAQLQLALHAMLSPEVRLSECLSNRHCMQCSRRRCVCLSASPIGVACNALADPFDL